MPMRRVEIARSLPVNVATSKLLPDYLLACFDFDPESIINDPQMWDLGYLEFSGRLIRATLFPLTGSLMYEQRFLTRTLRYMSLFRRPVPRAALPSNGGITPKAHSGAGNTFVVQILGDCFRALALRVLPKYPLNNTSFVFNYGPMPGTAA